MRRKQQWSAIVLGVAILVAGDVGLAAPILSATYAEAPNADPIYVSSITVGGATYADLVGPTDVSVALVLGMTGTSGALGAYRTAADTYDPRVGPSGWKDATAYDPAMPVLTDEDYRQTASAALTGLALRGFTGLGQMDVMFASPIRAGDDAGFFLLEHTGQDTIEILPLDAAGDVIAGWTTGVIDTWGQHLESDAAWESSSPEWYRDWQTDWRAYAPASVSLGGMTVTLSDFTGGGGTLTDVYGIRVIDAENGVDPFAVGQYGVVPEPATMVGFSLGAAAVALRRRRRR